MFNQTTLIGNLTRDVQHVAGKDDKKPRAVLDVATNTFWYSEDKRRQKTDYHRVVVFGAQAERVKDFTKGQQVFVLGKNQTRSFEQDDKKRYITEIIAQRIERLGPNGSQNPPESDASAS